MSKSINFRSIIMMPAGADQVGVPIIPNPNPFRPIVRHPLNPFPLVPAGNGWGSGRRMSIFPIFSPYENRVRPIFYRPYFPLMPAGNDRINNNGNFCAVRNGYFQNRNLRISLGVIAAIIGIAIAAIFYTSIAALVIGGILVAGGIIHACI